MKALHMNKKWQKRLILSAVFFCIVILYASPVFATAIDAQDSIKTSFATLFDIVSAIVSAIGAVVLLWGFFEWGISIQSNDPVMQSSAFKRIAGGLVMVLAPQLISAFIV